MSDLTMWGQPNSMKPFDVPVYPHQNTGFLAQQYFNQTDYDDYEDYAYYVTIEDFKTGAVYENITPPLGISGMSYIDVIQTVKSSVWYDYDPSLLTISNSPNHLARYKITIQDWFNNQAHIASATSNYVVVGNMNLVPFNMLEIDQIDLLEYNCNSSTDRFLTYTEPNAITKFQVQDEATWKTYGNHLQVVLSNRSKIFKLKYVINNQSFGYIVNEVGASVANQRDKDTLEFPIGPKNINNMSVVSASTITTLPNGFIFLDDSATSLSLKCGDTYTIQAFSETDVATSAKYHFEVYEDFEDNLISWSNDFGGTDYINCSKIAKKTITQAPKTFKTTKQGTYEGPYFHNDWQVGTVKKREDVIYQNEYREVYVLTTDILTIGELRKVENMFYSKEIEMNIDGVWYAALNTKKKNLILKNNNPKLKYYQFEIEVDKNKKLF